MAKSGASRKKVKSEGSKKKKVATAEKKKATRVTIHYDAGFNNNLYIRGHGGGLSWDRGVLLQNIGPDEWVWETTLPFNECEFKVLINDQQYEDGENHHLNGGIWFQYSPHF